MSRSLARSWSLAIALAALGAGGSAAAQGPPPPPPGAGAVPPAAPPGPPAPSGAPLPPPAPAGGDTAAPPAPPPPAPPPTPPAPAPAYGQPAYGQPGYGQPAYGQPAYGQPAYGMPPVPPPPPPEERRRGSDAATDDLVPLTHRGGISIESAVFTSAEERRLAGGSIALEARARLATHLYLDVRLPLSLAIGVSVGNPTLELRGMVPLGSGRDFIIAGGGMGFPVLDDSQLTDTAVIGNLANAMWDIHEHSPSTIPMVYRFGTEHHLGNIVILRTQIDPIINVPVGRNTDPELQIQHAVEAQIGRRTGGGFRIQGVAMPTWEDAELRELEDDLYQLAMEPFLALERERLGTRVGLLIPVDEIAGPPFVTSWGLRFMMAARLD